jgi:H/ACA ribonucleoprotein complex non-core subunit NAF1
LDPEKIQVSRQVFHLPNHSNFVFLSQLKKWKGSDASNVHDEEPADDELEFSDDEEEAAFKSQRKRKYVP